MSRLGQVGHRLYTGETSVDFVGRTRLWFRVSAVIIVVSALALGLRGLDFGIEFRGGTELRVPAASCSVQDARAAVADLLDGPAVVQQVGSKDIRVQTEALEEGRPGQVAAALAEACDVAEDDLSVQVIGPSWGGEVTRSAVTALVVFVALVVLFIAVAFEPKMAIAAIVALLHDIVITVGVYALVGFEVTPATIIGLLTILGYSLYDTVVVFDSIRENTRGITGQNAMTYGEAANLSVNQTLIRSINTSVIALLPVGSILVVGGYLLGAGTLQDLALVLFVGIVASTYSSIFIATPLLAYLKEREPVMRALTRRVQARRAGTRTTSPGTAIGPRAPRARDVVEDGVRRQPQRRTRAQRRRRP